MSAPWDQYAIDAAAWFAAHPTVAAAPGEAPPAFDAKTGLPVGPLPLPASPTLAQITAAHGAPTTMTDRFSRAALPLAVVATLLSRATHRYGLVSSRGLDDVEAWLRAYEVTL